MNDCLGQESSNSSFVCLFAWSMFIWCQVNTSFDENPTIAEMLQSSLESELRDLFTTGIPELVHKLSLQHLEDERRLGHMKNGKVVNKKKARVTAKSMPSSPELRRQTSTPSRRPPSSIRMMRWCIASNYIMSNSIAKPGEFTCLILSYLTTLIAGPIHIRKMKAVWWALNSLHIHISTPLCRHFRWQTNMSRIGTYLLFACLLMVPLLALYFFVFPIIHTYLNITERVHWQRQPR